MPPFQCADYITAAKCVKFHHLQLHTHTHTHIVLFCFLNEKKEMEQNKKVGENQTEGVNKVGHFKH